MTVYTMAHIDVHDADEYAQYAELAGPAVAFWLIDPDAQIVMYWRQAGP